MNLTVSGRQVELGEALQTYVNAESEKMFEKYHQQKVDAQVTFVRERYQFRCDIKARIDDGLLTQSSGDGPDVYLAFQDALDHLEKQIRRYRRRLRNHKASP